MTILAKWLGTAAAAGALALTPLIADAAGPGGGHAAVSGGHSRGHWGGGHGFGSGSRFDRPHWSGSHWYGGHWGYRGGWYARPSVGFYFGVPLFWGPWWDSYYYPGERIVYREVVSEPQPIEGTLQRAPAEGSASEPAAPAAANPLATNYCASAKAYFPEVKSCPEGWQHTAPNS